MKTQILLIVRNRLMKIQFIGYVLLMVVFLVMNFQQKSSLNELLNTTLNQGDKIHLILINEYEEEAKKRSLTETEEKWLEDAVAYHRAATAFQNQDYKTYIKEQIHFWELRLELRDKEQSPLPIYNTIGFNPSKQEQLEYKNVKQYLMEFRSLEEKGRYQLDDILQMQNRIFWMEWTKYNEPMLYWLPGLFSILLLFISPILLDDWKHRSMLAVKPIRQWKYLLQKISSYWLVNMALVILVLFVVFLVQSVSFGWDTFTSPLLVFRGDEEVLMLPLQFIGIVLLFAACVFLFLINLVAWCNQLSRNKMVGFIAGLMVIWAEPIFRSMKIYPSFADKLPLYYVNFGSVIQGMKDDFYATGTFTISNGCASLLVGAFVFFLLTIGTSCWQERQRRGGSV